jgi:hypothetical protein
MCSHTRDESFFKIGVTHHKDFMLRFTTYGTEKIQGSALSKFEQLKLHIAGQKYLFPYEVELVHEVDFLREVDAHKAESSIIKEVSRQRHYPTVDFSGRSECFSADQAQLELVKSCMSDLADAALKGALR